MLTGTLILAEYYRFDKKNAMNLSHSKQTPPSHLYSKTLYVSNNLTASLGYSIPCLQIKFNETVTLSPLQMHAHPLRWERDFTRQTGISASKYITSIAATLES